MSKENFKAVVFSGLGEGEFYVNLYARNFRRVLGFTPYPGTLNLRLKDDVSVNSYVNLLKGLEPIVVEPPSIGDLRLGRVLVYPAELNGTVRVYIVRPEITSYRNDVIEVISELRLRDLLDLSDGDVVTISIGDP